MGILRNERTSPNNSKDDSRQDGIISIMQPDFEAKREEFRRYLEHAGVIDALTKVLVSLYEETEKPDDALQYVCKYLGGLTKDIGEVEILKKELEEAKAQITELESKMAKFVIEEESSA